MKKKITIIVTGLISACIILNSCDVFTKKSSVNEDYVNYLKSEQYKTDLNNLKYAAALNECMRIVMIRFYSNDFTMKKGDKLDFKKKKLYYWGNYYAIMNTLEEHREEFDASMKRLEEHKVFSTATPTRNKEGKLTAEISTLPNNSNPFSFVASPAYATPAQPAFITQPLLIQEFCEFCGISTELSKESRKMTIAIASNLSNSDLKEIYRKLPDDIKNGETDYKKWWTNLQDGKYDVKGHKIYSTILCDQTNPANEHFLGQADDMGLLDPGDFVKKAKRVVTAGAKLNLECFNKVMCVMMPGGPNSISYGDVYDKVEIVSNTADLGQKIVTGEVTMDDAMGYVALTEKTIIGKQIKGVTMNVPGVGAVELDSPWLGAGEVQQGVGLMLDKANNLIKRLAGEKEDSPKLDWEEDEPTEKATITVSDASDTPAEEIIVENINTGEVFIGVGTDKDGNTSITVPKGDYNITTVDSNGDKWTTTDKHVNEGENVEFEGNTEETELWDEFINQENEDGNDDSNFFDDLIDIINGDKDVFGNATSKGEEKKLSNTEGIDGIEDMTDEEAETMRNALDERDAAREEDEYNGKDPNAGIIPPGEDEEVENSNSTKASNGEFDIVGKWHTVTVNKLICTSEILKLEDEDWTLARSIKFTARENNTCTLSTYEESISGTYSFDGMTLAINAGGEKMICPVIKIGSNKMNVTFSDESLIMVITMQK